MAKWLTKGSLPITDTASAAWAQGWHMHGVDDLGRCVIQGFLLRYNGNRANPVEAPNGPSAERNPESIQRDLDKELANGHIIGPWDKPPLKAARHQARGHKEPANHNGKHAPGQCSQRRHP